MDSTYAETAACGVDEGQEMCQEDESLREILRKENRHFHSPVGTTRVSNRVETNVVESATKHVRRVCG